MPRVPLRELLPRSGSLSDAALADEHSFEILRLLLTAAPEDRLVLFDFDGIARVGAVTTYIERFRHISRAKNSWMTPSSDSVLC